MLLMRKTMPFLLLLFCLPFLAFAPERSGERAPIIRPGKDYALFFAVHQYEDSQLTDLPNTVKNTREIEKVLKDKYAFETEFIENPKLDDIEQKLEEYRWKFASGAFPKDGQLLVFFSGHGVQEYNNGYSPLPLSKQTLFATSSGNAIWTLMRPCKPTPPFPAATLPPILSHSTLGFTPNNPYLCTSISKIC